MTPALADAPPRTITEEYFARLALEQLVECSLNPRKTFDDEKLKELAASILEKGVLEPLVVRKDEASDDDDPVFEIVCGARRYRAAQLAGLSHVPTVVRRYTDAQAVEIMSIENSQRDDVPPLEEAAGYKQLLLIDQTYTPAMIASRIGHTERYVFDRMRLLELVPELQAHLTAGRIGVEHAEVLAKLKPAEQKIAAHPDRGAVFEHDYALKFDDAENPFKFKVRSVRQLKEWIARHIRFDVQHAAQTAPLEFADQAQRVAEAEAQPGRGKKVVPITFDHTCPDGAKHDTERTYGATAWKRAVGKDGQPTCDHAVLGIVVAGEHYGDTFHVCIARDKCTVHWKDSVAAKQKAEKLRASGKGKQAAKVEKKAERKTEDRWERERRERRAREDAWGSIEGAVLGEAAEQVKGVSALTAKHAAALEKTVDGVCYEEVKKHLGANWFKTPAAALLVSAVTSFGFNSWENTHAGIDEYIREIAVPFGLDVKKLRAAAEAHAPQAVAATAPTSGSGAKKTNAKKAAKRR